MKRHVIIKTDYPCINKMSSELSAVIWYVEWGFVNNLQTIEKPVTVNVWIIQMIIWRVHNQTLIVRRNVTNATWFAELMCVLWDWCKRLMFSPFTNQNLARVSAQYRTEKNIVYVFTVNNNYSFHIMSLLILFHDICTWFLIDITDILIVKEPKHERRHV